MLAQESTVGSMTQRAAATRVLLSKYGAWINKYRGGLPAGWMAVIMLWESGGNFAAPGDPSLGEVGFYQITKSIPGLFGLPAEARMDPETNICLAALEYQYEAVKFKLQFPQLQLGTADSYKIARLVFAVGRGGTTALAMAASPLRPGDCYGTIRDYVTRNGGMALSAGQDATKVWFRVLNIEIQWAIGRQADPGYVGGPQIPPNPPAGPITIPADVAPYFSKPIAGIVWVLGGLAGAFAYLFTRRRK